MKDRIKMIVDMFQAGICPTCFNEPTKDWCVTCVKKRGVKRTDLVEGRITIEQINALPFKL